MGKLNKVCLSPRAKASASQPRATHYTETDDRSQEKTANKKGVIERSARRDPHASPPIGPKDVAAGLFSLVNRGLVAAHVDLTPVRPAVTLDGTCELCMHAHGHWRARGGGWGGPECKSPETTGVGTTSCPCPPSPVENASAQGPVWPSLLLRIHLSFWVQCVEHEARPLVGFAARSCFSPKPTPHPRKVSVRLSRCWHNPRGHEDGASGNRCSTRAEDVATGSHGVAGQTVARRRRCGQRCDAAAGRPERRKTSARV